MVWLWHVATGLTVSQRTPAPRRHGQHTVRALGPAASAAVSAANHRKSWCRRGPLHPPQPFLPAGSRFHSSMPAVCTPRCSFYSESHGRTPPGSASPSGITSHFYPSRRAAAAGGPEDDTGAAHGGHSHVQPVDNDDLVSAGDATVGGASGRQAADAPAAAPAP